MNLPIRQASACDLNRMVIKDMSAFPFTRSEFLGFPGDPGCRRRIVRAASPCDYSYGDPASVYPIPARPHTRKTAGSHAAGCHG